MVLEKKWEYYPENFKLQNEMATSLKISSIVAHILINRGFTDIGSARTFLEASISGLHNPFLLKDIRIAISRLKEAIESEEKITIYGDYDVDGVTSIYILTTLIEELGGMVDYYIPHRLEEGYGLNKEAITKIHQNGTELLVTVDCGINAFEDVDYAKELGLDVIVTDHHEPPEERVPALAVINPKQNECKYPFTDLAGVGVAFKFGQGLVEDMLGEEASISYIERFLDIVALGTVADIVPLIDENRIMVKHGLNRLSVTSNIGLKALMKVAGISKAQLDEDDISFTLAPRINAVGRMGQPEDGVKLLKSVNFEEALAIARRLEDENRIRKEMEAKVFEEAISFMEEQVHLDRERVIVVAGQDWHIGVVGIVASRICDIYYRPVILISLCEGEEGKASGRSIEGFNIYESLKVSSDLLVSFGGHEYAAGLSIEADKIDEFRDRINEYAMEVMREEDLIPKLRMDTSIGLEDATLLLVQELEALKPFGPENPRPILSCSELGILEYRRVGSDNAHLKLKVSDGDVSIDAMGFNMGHVVEELFHESGSVSLAFSLELETWGGRIAPQLHLKDIKFSSLEQDRSSSLMNRLSLKMVDILREQNLEGHTDATIYTKVFEGKSTPYNQLVWGEEVYLIREEGSPYDIDSLKVVDSQGQDIGRIKRDIARRLLLAMDSGMTFKAIALPMTCKKDPDRLNIFITKATLPVSCEDNRLFQSRETTGAYNSSLKSERLRQDEQSFFESFVSAALDISSAAIDKKNSVYLLPMRDAAERAYVTVRKNFQKNGFKVTKGVGALSPEEMSHLAVTLLQTELPFIIIATPNFIEYALSQKIIAPYSVGLLAIDPRFSLMGDSQLEDGISRIQELLDNPVLFQGNLPSCDLQIKSTLRFVDNRGRIDSGEERIREAMNIFFQEKSRILIYVGTDEEAIALSKKAARIFADEFNETGDNVGFLCSRLPSNYRREVEELFCEGPLQVLIVSEECQLSRLPRDLSHIFLCTFPSNIVHFYSMINSWGLYESCQIHLFYSPADFRAKELRIYERNPDRDELAELYVALRSIAGRGVAPVSGTIEEFAYRFSTLRKVRLGYNTVEAGLSIFEEVGLVDREREGRINYICMISPPSRGVDLQSSVRYNEGKKMRDEFQRFAAIAMDTNVQKLIELFK